MLYIRAMRESKRSQICAIARNRAAIKFASNIVYVYVLSLLVACKITILHVYMYILYIYIYTHTYKTTWWYQLYIYIRLVWRIVSAAAARRLYVKYISAQLRNNSARSIRFMCSKQLDLVSLKPPFKSYTDTYKTRKRSIACTRQTFVEYSPRNASTFSRARVCVRAFTKWM